MSCLFYFNLGKRWSPEILGLAQAWIQNENWNVVSLTTSLTVSYTRIKTGFCCLPSCTRYSWESKVASVAPFIWIKQNQYSDISFIYTLSNLGNVKTNAAFPEEGIVQVFYRKSKTINKIWTFTPINWSIFNLYSGREACGSILEALSAV